MRFCSALVLVAIPLSASAQTAQIERAINLRLEQKARQETLQYIQSLFDRDTGAYKVEPNGKPSYRACNGASKAIKYLGGKVQPDRERTAAFVLACYDPKTGTFAERGGKADVASTSTGVITAVEFGIPKEKFAKSLDYLRDNAKTFDEVRIAAAAVEAWGVKDCPFKLDGWVEVGRAHVTSTKPDPNGGTREIGSAAAVALRLGFPVGQQEKAALVKVLRDGQRDDGGWCKKDAKTSDLETNYRVMRSLRLLQAKPTNPTALWALITKCRNTDGGYGVEPGQPSTMSGTYYAITILHWLAELE